MARKVNSAAITPLMLLVVIIVFFQRVTINTDANVNSSFQSSSAAYAVALSTVLLIGFSYAYYNKVFMRLPRNIVTISILVFYLIASISAINSFLPLLSGFRAVSGIGLTLAASAYGQYLARNYASSFEYQIFCFALAICATYSIGSAIFQVQVLNVPLIPLRGGMGATIFLLLCIWKIIDLYSSRNYRNISLVCLFFMIGIFLNSASAVMSFGMALLFLALVNGRMLLFLTGFAGVSIATFGFIEYLNANIDDVIFNKPARAYLIGTGRFPLLSFAIDYYKTEFTIAQQVFGVGFMAEREILKLSELSWTSNLHNSMISNLLGVGVVGFFASAVFLVAPFFLFSRIKNIAGGALANKWIACHLIFLFFGFTSSDYPNSPSWLLLIFLTFNSGVVCIVRKSANRDREFG
ncbi:hypothetical protein FHS72_003571 [Loktanella ponticola]|uniref:O-antigen ligase domain-containing protein n=1 Tax=Yoonia ponticola TaxID=1524255 RepID=A0A7W9EZN9_9RHOB|nr:hypothetical protein [Yoonia ponticola]MBB5723924.1 hypothetical protein [Yoonia ponticola]